MSMAQISGSEAPANRSGSETSRYRPSSTMRKQLAADEEAIDRMIKRNIEQFGP